MAKTFRTQDPNVGPVAVNESQATSLRNLKNLSQDVKDLLKDVSDIQNTTKIISQDLLDEIKENLEAIQTTSVSTFDSLRGSAEELSNIEKILKSVVDTSRVDQSLRKGSLSLSRLLSAEVRRQYSMQVTGEGISRQAVASRKRAVTSLRLEQEALKQSFEDAARGVKTFQNFFTKKGFNYEGMIRKFGNSKNDTLRSFAEIAASIQDSQTSVDTLSDSVNNLDKAWKQSTKDISTQNSKLETYSRLARRLGLGGLADQISTVKGEASAAYYRTYLSTGDSKKARDSYKNTLGEFGSFGGVLKAVRDEVGHLITSGALFAGLGLLIFRQLLKFDEEAVKTKRVIGQWGTEAAVVNTKFVTGTEVLKTMRDLGEQFHFNPIQVFTPQELAAIAQAQKLTGMTAQAAGNLGVQSRINGVHINQYRDSIAAGANSANKLNHSAVNLSAVQNDVLTTSRAIALSYGSSVEALARAAGSAAALGMNLQDVENIAKNLMNFESSIESEMQAQLLTGQQLNLAKAREYSLNNDLDGVLREIGRQGVNAASWGRMNYIQQENMAKALGMSREQMAKMLIMQQINSGLTAKQVAAMTGMRREDIEALSAQEKWQTMKQKFLESLVPLLEPVLQITSDILRLVTPIAGILSWMVSGWRKLVLIIAAIPILLIKGVKALGIFKAGLTGVAGAAKTVGSAIGNWVSKLRGGIGAEVVFDKKANRWRNAKTGRFAKAPTPAAGRGINPAGAASAASSTAPTAARGVGGMSKLFSSIGKNIGKIALGAAAMAIMSLALIGIAKALQMLKDVEWKQFGMMAASLGVLAGTVMVLGTIMMSGWGAAAFMLGTVALTGLALAMGVVGIAVRSLGEGLQSIPTGVELGSIASGITSIAAAVGVLATKLDTLPLRRLRALGKAFKRLKGSNIQVQEGISNEGESIGTPRENIETAVQGIVIKQAQVQASAQQISIEQQATDLSKIEAKLTSIITELKNSRPSWDWVKFDTAYKTNISW